MVFGVSVERRYYKLMIAPIDALIKQSENRRVTRVRRWHFLAFLLLATAAGLSAIPTMVLAVWNNPYPEEQKGQNIYYSAFSERPKRLDPARSYSANEYLFIANIYEPPFQYHYLKRPYELEPLTAEAVPVAVYLDKNNRRLPENAPGNKVHLSVYRIQIKPGIQFQPHPAFHQDKDGKPTYLNMQPEQIERHNEIADFTKTGTRELVANDYIYQIKRLAHPGLHSPIYSIMASYIVGFEDLHKELLKDYQEARASGEHVFIDLNRYELEGVRLIDKYTYEIRLKGKYPQFLFWMAMPFFAPMAPEVDRFFSQSGMAEKNLTLDWYAVGTGPYMLTVNNPNRLMVMERNPNYHEDYYPDQGENTDADTGLLKDAGKRLPFIDKIVFSLEKEGIPRWNKFLQGYYDASGISTESFDRAVNISRAGDVRVSDEMADRGIRLITSVATSTYYFGFNMLDPVVGGYSERARKLRQAISIAIDYEEEISIFRNDRGIAAQGPIPPGIFGYKEGQNGINPYVYDWVDDAPKRKPIAYAKTLLNQAGYKKGIDPKTGNPLLLKYDVTGTGPEVKAQLDWMRKQFAKLNIQLVIQNTDYNRFQEKMHKGTAQMFQWGWNADYPDPENFLFLLYGPNRKVGKHGENASNYENPEFDRLFNRMKDMENGPERQRIIDNMLEILRRDAPWVWGFHPKEYALIHDWVYNNKPNHMANNTLKYRRIDPAARDGKRREWNRPVLWPIIVAVVMVLGIIAPAMISYRRRERETVS